jgi:membrane fusion protein (multidrug efflux system)
MRFIARVASSPRIAIEASRTAVLPYGHGECEMPKLTGFSQVVHHSHADQLGPNPESTPSNTMKFALLPLAIFAFCGLALPGCQQSEAHEHHEKLHKIVVTSPQIQDVISTQQYVCQIHSCRHIEVRALEGGYLEKIPVKEGQTVKEGELLFKILPTLYTAKLNSEVAEAQQEQIEFDNTKRLFEQKVVSQQELAMAQARLAKAKAQVELAQAELNFTDIRAPFAGIIDRLQNQHGSRIVEGDVLTTLSDNSVMWVYFNVPEARYLEYKADLEKHADDLSVELVLANGEKFPQPGKIGAIEADFNNQTGNIAFRADFPNPGGLLRHGQTGNVLIHRPVPGALVIPQRATFEILDKLYAYVVGEDGIVHQRDIEVESELDDIYLIKSGLDVNDKIVLEGIRQVHDGEHVEYKYESPEQVLAHLKYRAE